MAGGLNTYAYALNAPTMLTDPLGLETPTVTLQGMLPPQGFDFAYFAASGFGYSTSLAITMGGNVYFSPPGMGLAKPNGLSVFGGIGFVNPAPSCPADASAAQREQQADDILNQLSYSVTGGFYAGGGVVWSPGTGTATLPGLTTPGFGGGGSVSFPIGH